MLRKHQEEKNSQFMNKEKLRKRKGKRSARKKGGEKNEKAILQNLTQKTAPLLSVRLGEEEQP